MAGAYETPVRSSWTEDSATTMTLTWDREAPGRGMVRYGVSTNFTHLARDAGGVHQHVLTLRGLMPGTRYYYQASSSDGYDSSVGTFKTAPASKDAPLHFVVHGDLQGGLEEAWARDVSATIVQEAPDFVLHTGDMAEDQFSGSGFDSWGLFFDICGEELARFPFMPNMGNHDQDPTDQSLSLMYRLFQLPEAYPGNGYYAYTVGGTRFIALNSNLSPEGQTNWLARELQAAAYDTNLIWIIAHFHHPPYSWGERAGWDEGKAAWSPLFAQYEADWVIGGHSHNYQRTVPIRGVRYMVAGGGGGRLYASGNDPAQAFATTCYHYASFHVTGDVLQVRGLRSDGQLFDRETVAKRRVVRVEPAFPRRGESAKVYYRASSGPLYYSSPVYIHIGQDAFAGAFADAAMTYNAATDLWEYEFVVPATASNRVAFVFHDAAGTNWHNNYTYNWQALLDRVSLSPSLPVAGSNLTIRYEADMEGLAGGGPVQVFLHWGSRAGLPTGLVTMAFAGGARWECVVPVPPYATSLDMAFYNGSVWDEDFKRYWRRPVAGAVAWGATPYVAPGSPVITEKPLSGQNNPGDNFDFSMASPALRGQDVPKGFGDFGELYFNYDATNLYIGGHGANLGGSNNVFLLFMGLDTLSDNAWNLWHKSGPPQALDRLHNLRLTEPMDVAIVLGDEYGDSATNASFVYGGYDFGQGVYYIGTNSSAFVAVPGARLSQFDGTGTIACVTANDDGGRWTKRWESSLPWASLGAAGGVTSVQHLLVAGVVASASTNGQDRYLSRTFVGEGAWGSKDAFRQYAFNTVHLRPVRVHFLHADFQGEGIPNAWRLEHFQSEDGPRAQDDPDGDGVDNWGEYVAGTQPTNAGSFLQMREGSPASGPAWVLQWPSASNRMYDVRAAFSPMESYGLLATNLPATPPLNVYTVAVDSADLRILAVEARWE